MFKHQLRPGAIIVGRDSDRLHAIDSPIGLAEGAIPHGVEVGPLFDHRQVVIDLTLNAVQNTVLNKIGWRIFTLVS
jgi:hypothetical protein